MKSLDLKISKILKGDSNPKNFIIADAKDADMANGIYSGGFDGTTGASRNMDAYREQIRKVIKQGIVDIMLMSASNLEVLAKEEGLFKNSKITPAARGNDTTDIWVCRNSCYTKEPSRAFSSASIDSIKKAGADLALYSVTFNNRLEQDYEALAKLKAFREEAEAKKFRYFLEVFNPNALNGIKEKDMPFYVNDCIARCLAGAVKAQRPLFLKIAYNGPKAMEELASYDSRLIVGILGGSSGTTMDAFTLLHDAQKYGAKVALFGRKINNSQSPLHFIECLRGVADGELSPKDAVKLYHDKMKKAGIKPKVSLVKDLALSNKVLQSYG